MQLHASAGTLSLPNPALKVQDRLTVAAADICKQIKGLPLFPVHMGA